MHTRCGGARKAGEAATTATAAADTRQSGSLEGGGWCRAAAANPSGGSWEGGDANRRRDPANEGEMAEGSPQEGSHRIWENSFTPFCPNHRPLQNGDSPSDFHPPSGTGER